MNNRNLLFVIVAFVLTLVSTVEGFAARASAAKAKVWTGKDLPSLDVSDGGVPAPNGVSSKEFYLPTYTLLRAGPVSFVQRLADPKKYEKTVFKYMSEFKEESLMTAQGNADAYLAAPGKMIE